ncbi:MAG: Gfo/Idh/MocA family oxidoreductase [Arachidicoccus sp.]|nr:Gfo/Idh/MocA family oxidoreductase [Arachidicoccus sp.]
MTTKKLRMGMIGGGKNAFIGAVHRAAANMDGLIELVCGAFSSNAKTSIESGISLGLPENRIYASFEEMIQKESALSADERMQFVSIVTPNHAHFAPAMLALENGFHVMIGKAYDLLLGRSKRIKKESG